MPDENLQALLLRHALITRAQLIWAVEFTRDTDRTWLEQLLLVNAVDEDEICTCVSHDLCVPRCSGDRLVGLTPAILARLPMELAIEHRIMPLGCDDEGDLQVAMVDPTDRAALQEIRFFAGRVLRAVAPATSIAWALHEYCGVSSALWPRPPIRTAAMS
jgi:type II secretion system (T2SS) protein E